MRNRTLIRFGLLLLLFAGANGAWAQGLTIEINDGSRTADPIVSQQGERGHADQEGQPQGRIGERR